MTDVQPPIDPRPDGPQTPSAPATPPGDDSQSAAPRSKTARSSGAARLGRRIGIGLLIALLTLATLIALLYLNRRATTREILVGWLHQRGIDADVEIERIELDGLVARIRVGDPDSPDLIVDRVEVDYAVGMPWMKGGLGVTPSRVRLLHPVMRATWADGKLSLGSLDPLIEEFTGKPPRPDSTSPIVIIERGEIDLTTEYGLVRATGDARLEDGRLMRLSAALPAADLKSDETTAEGLSAKVDLTTVDNHTTFRIEAAANAFRITGMPNTSGARQDATVTSSLISGQGVSVTLAGDTPYPDTRLKRSDGKAVIEAALNADMMSGAGYTAQGAAQKLRFDGAIEGWIDAFRLNGLATSQTTFDRIQGEGLDARSAVLDLTEGELSLNRTARDLIWRVSAPTRLSAARLDAGATRAQALTLRSPALVFGGRGAALEASGPLALSAGQITSGDISLSDARGSLDLDMVQDGAVLVTAEGALSARRGSWPMLGPIASDDEADMVEMKRALSAFAIEAPGLRLAAGSSGTVLALTRPVRVSPNNGGVLTLSPGARPLFVMEPNAAGGGSARVVATRGRGLPEAQISIPDWRLTPGGFQASLDGGAALDFGMARGLKLNTKGRLVSDRGRMTYLADGCIPLTIDKIDMEENAVLNVGGNVCPDGAAPIIAMQDGRWRAQAQVRDFNADAPFLEMNFREAAGRMIATGSKGDMGVEGRIGSARVDDAAETTRFHPIRAAGDITLRRERWAGGFDLTSIAKDADLGRLTLHHDGVSGKGGIVIDAPGLTFAENSLQPDDLTPLTEGFLESPVVGSVGFNGHMNWSADKTAQPDSGGRLSIPSLDFVSPAGPVKGLSGDIVFTSLAPPTTAPGQTLHADAIETALNLTALNALFTVSTDSVAIGASELTAAGGRVRVEPFTVPLDPTAGFGGVIVLERVQLGEITSSLDMEDRVSLDAVVSGRLPFTYDAARGFRISGGSLAADQPGRLSIKRDALKDVEAAGAGADVPQNTVVDLAYQALEDLAFQTLTADVESGDQGRMNVRFHIVGRHDPPQRQEARIGLMELINRTFLTRPLPLPSDTGVDLTLDTNLNLNQLIADLIAVQRSAYGRDQTPDPAPSGAQNPSAQDAGT